MNFVKRSTRTSPKVSLILLDWSVRESFHILHYLMNQTAGRDSFEVIVIEYYSRMSEAVKKFEDHVDTWVCLEIPDECYYHKHLMYNAGIVLAKGEIVVICDSDAMVNKSSVQTIIDTFEKESNIVLHFDQFRNVRRDFYPFNFPSFNEVAGDGCINNINGKPAGLQSNVDTIHTRNYGACMCAKRDDLIAIGGSDEHIDYLGHICGPYDMTFRLVNSGLKEIWSETEFLYHTWHPGQAGDNNYLGPHDGRHIATRAIDTLISGHHEPAVENAAIKALRNGNQTKHEFLEKVLINKNHLMEWQVQTANSLSLMQGYVAYHMGFRIVKKDEGLEAYPLFGSVEQENKISVEGGSLHEIFQKIHAAIPASVRIAVKPIPFLILLLLLLVEAPKLFGSVAKNVFMNIGKRGMPASTSSNLPSGGLFSKLKSWFERILAIRDYEAESVVGLIVNLSLMKKTGHKALTNDRLTMFVERKMLKIMVVAFQLVTLAPKVNIEIIRDADRLRKRMDDLSGESSVIISRNLLLRHHALMTSLDARRRAFII